MERLRDLPAGSIFLSAGAGRNYAMGALRAVFKADGEETGNRYCVSEWWLEPHTEGPGAHLHEENDEIFYVLDGEPSVLVGETWIEAGSLVERTVVGENCGDGIEMLQGGMVLSNLITLNTCGSAGIRGDADNPNIGYGDNVVTHHSSLPVGVLPLTPNVCETGC